jgi:hypothetical protein
MNEKSFRQIDFRHLSCWEREKRRDVVWGFLYYIPHERHPKATWVVDVEAVAAPQRYVYHHGWVTLYHTLVRTYQRQHGTHSFT